MRTIPGIKDQLEPLENAIRNKLIPELLGGQQCNSETTSFTSKIR